jgi:HD-GYP domain-containing protein (c-di-GMP phosphodiesterase class II)
MVEVPIDFVKPGDIIGKHHSFKKFAGGMRSAVDLMKGYKITEKILKKLKNEFNVQSLFIISQFDDIDGLTYEEGFEEGERQKVIDAIIQNMNSIKNSGTIDMKPIRAVVEDIINHVFRIIKTGKGSFKTLSQAFADVQSHDAYTWEHSVNTAIYSAIITFEASDILTEVKDVRSIGGFTEQENIVLNMLLHDVGKTYIPLQVLNKKDKLTESEVALIHKHPYTGFVLLRKINERHKEKKMPLIPSYLRKACLFHHQSYDGSGYPNLKIDMDVRPYKSQEIPLVGRIAAVADIYDALTSSRPYRLPLHPAEALKIMNKEKGRRLDPRLTEALIKNITPFPKGSTVMLSNNELAIVTGYVDNNKFNPIVKPYMKKIYKDGKEEIIRLPYRDNVEIRPGSKIKLIVNKKVYRLVDDYNHKILS